MKTSALVKAMAGTVVVVAVVTGVVLWIRSEKASIERIEAGMRAAAQERSLVVARTAEEATELRREKEALAFEKEKLTKEKAELENNVATLSERVKTLS